MCVPLRGPFWDLRDGPPLSSVLGVFSVLFRRDPHPHSTGLNPGVCEQLQGSTCPSSSFFCNLPRTSQHCVSHPAPPAPSSGQKASALSILLCCTLPVNAPLPPLGVRWGEQGERVAGSLTLLGNSSCRQEGSSWAPMSPLSLLLLWSPWGVGAGRVKTAKEMNRGFPHCPRVNRTWSQNKRELFLATPVTHFPIQGCLPSRSGTQRTCGTLTAISEAYQILGFLSNPPLPFTRRSPRIGCSCVLVRFNGCTPFHPKLDPWLFTWCLRTLRFSLRGSGYTTAPCYLDALQ